MGIREEQREKRRHEILEAALDLFIRKGYAATKISDIAKSVGMSAGLLFHYFKSKEKLYEELIAIGIAGPMSIMAPADIEPLMFFTKVAEQTLHYIKTESFTAKMFMLMKQTFFNEATSQNIKDKLRDFDIYTPTVLLMQQGQANGTIREGNPFALAVAYWSVIQGIAEQIAFYPDLPCPQSEWIIDMIRRK